jgi:hypothetical protein
MRLFIALEVYEENMNSELKTLYELVEESRHDEVCDLILDVFYQDENPLDTIFRVAVESGLAYGEAKPVPETQTERIDRFLNEVDFDRLDLEAMVSIMSYCHPFKENLEAYSSTRQYYSERFKKTIEARPGLAF